MSSKLHPHLPDINRRAALLGLAGTLLFGRTRIAFANSSDERRLVVIVLRGAMDGLSVVHPYGDSAYRDVRGTLAMPDPGQDGGLLDLGGFYGLHPAMPRLHALYKAGQVLPVHAIAGSYRSRSHFDAQDYLESGANHRLSSGWLNRALESASNTRLEQAIAVGSGGIPLLLRGPAAVGTYAPVALGRPNQATMGQVLELYNNDPLLGAPLAEGLRARGFADSALGDGAPRDMRDTRTIALSTGRLLANAAGPRVAAIELDGWDTHVSQLRRLATLLSNLDIMLDGLREGLGNTWSNTVIMALTEFGRTVRVNGTQGTDHGTAGLALVLGGNVQGGRVLADWPGLAESRLFEQRDLQPTRDVCSLAKGVLYEHMKLEHSDLAAAFPNSDRVTVERGIVKT